MYYIKELEKYSSACPTQWQGKLMCGKTFYIRYRHGRLTVEISEQKTDDYYEAVCGKLIYGKYVGDGLDGCMETNEMLKHIKSVMRYRKL